MTDRVIAEPGLFMTDATRTAIGKETLDALQQAPATNKHVIVFGPGDFSPEGKVTPELTEQFNKVGFDPSLQLNGPDQTPITIGEQLNYVAGTGVAIAGERPKLMMEDFADNACIVTLPMEGGQINMHDHVYDLRLSTDYSTASLGIDPGWMDKERIIGKENDYQTWVAHHESNHCENSDGPHAEYRSDAYANQQYAKDFLAGRVQDTEVPYFVRTQRAVTQMLGVEGDAYSTTPFSPLAGEPALSDAALDAAAGQLNEARNRIYESIEQKTGMDMHEIPEDQDQRVSRLRTIYTESKLMNAQGKLDDLPYGKLATERFIEGAERYGHALYDVMPEDQIDTLPTLANPMMGLMPGLQARPAMGLNAASP